ncbi:peptidoglycan L-alanyl-D-glutamate endopeptidase CwlK [Flavobacterium arsenatis]|uniref:Peptidoglycan L-alanyl-D-glutamate endopeptidase CwlK n=1 Tax=Flavobacterium arsenatis TaxID=1484332 RepID=A0ABU1TRJ7_9FLAO|nr:M15 family metallopeptidase [Flavobacterium arsenatis]MDR6968492.1 peptidoglycan L-alanyl-D-glutamate endopeptidase CwlK [Flavobacterium arsenatis]
MDIPTQNRIAKLHPLVREEVAKIIHECDIALTGRAKIRITQGLRTFKEQQDLYALGRTKVNPDGKSLKKPMGNKVTNAKAGQSIHNYGFAVDMVLIIDGKNVSWNTTKDWDNDQVADWYECVKIFAKHGWEWGGNWKTFKDLPHFDKKGYNSWQKLSKLKLDKNGYVML